MEKSFEIDIKRLIMEIVYKLWIIAIVAVSMSLVFFAYAKIKLVPMYTASASLYVNNYVKPDNVDISKVSAGDLATSERLVQTYLTFLRSETVLQEVADQCGPEFTAGAISSMLGAQAIEDTEAFRITITYSDPEIAAEIVNRVADVAPKVIADFVEGSSVKVVDHAKPPQVRSFPIYRKYILFGGFMGGGIATIIIILLFLFNSKISSEDDITRLFTAPVIGQIPNYDQVLEKGYGYSKYKYKYRYSEKNNKR